MNKRVKFRAENVPSAENAQESVVLTTCQNQRMGLFCNWVNSSGVYAPLREGGEMKIEIEILDGTYFIGTVLGENGHGT